MSSISESIKKDHRELESFYDQIINATDDDTKVRFQNQFVWELARHSIGEELLVYPAMEKHLSNGKELADRDRQEHQKVRGNLLLYCV
jgi:hemerythrin superfamily protein